MSVKKRGQITIFLILGVVLLAVFGFLFYSAGILQGSSDADIRRSQVSDTRKSSVSFYVDSLITESFKECLRLVGEQGGRIFQDQYGNSVFNPGSYIEYGPHKRIGVGIKSGIVGDYQGAGLYRARRKNTLVIEDTYPGGSGYIYGLNGPLPPMDAAGGDESIEKQLGDCTRRRFVSKFDIRPFLEMDYKVELLQPKPNVSVSINVEDISVETYFPIKIGTGNTEIITKDYYYKLNFNFRVLYGFIREIIQRDIYELDVNIVELSRPEYLVTREEARGVDSFTGLKCDVINVTDNGFELDNKPFVFRFIRENRPPDANTVNFKPPWPDVVANDKAVLMCPNYKSASKLVDPDEDDLYVKRQDFETNEWYEFASKCNMDPDDCGIRSPVEVDTDDCMVCCLRPLVVWITDYGELTDIKPFGKAIICGDPDPSGEGGGCCDDDGCWRTKGEDEPCDERDKEHGENCPRPDQDTKKFTSTFNYYCDYCGRCEVKGEKVPGTETRENC